MPSSTTAAGEPTTPGWRRGDLSRAQFVIALLVLVALASALRLVFPVADPPTQPSIGVVWHDEGAWVHNARNRALFGEWTLDEWNPMYVTPVLTGLEYIGFRALGVGLRQARLVPELLGILSVLLLGLGVARVANRLAGVIAGALLATSFVYVMYDRAATIEGTLVAFLVMSWYGYARAGDSPRWGFVAGVAAMVAYFTKASAVFFVIALVLDAALSFLVAGGPTAGTRGSLRSQFHWLRRTPAQRASLYVLAGIGVAAVVALATFVLPQWQQYRFYNWQISVTRKPVYTLAALLDRASWLPVASDFFTRMWMVLVLALIGGLGRLAAWRRLPGGERLLLWWIGLGVAELILHDVQERRLLFLIPPMVALAAIALGERRLVVAETARLEPRSLALAAPFLFYATYLATAAIGRVPFLALSDAIRPGVRTGVALAGVVGVLFVAARRRIIAWLVDARCAAGGVVLVAALIAGTDLVQFAQWASVRTYKNYEAMTLIATWLPPGTLVHGKLANGLDLESRIRPVFVGRGFGNYEDRRRRDDVRYILTYLSPFVGYEGGRDAASGRPIIWDVLEMYPHRRVLHVFDVAESPAGTDAAILIDKMPERPGSDR